MNEIDNCGDECTINLHCKRLCRSSKELWRQLSSFTCRGCPCGVSPSYTNVAEACALCSVWTQSGCQAVCVVNYERAGNLNQMYYNRVPRTYDVGLLQIGQNNWASCHNGSAPCSLTANFNCAIKMFQFGGNSCKNWPSCSDCAECCNHP